MTLTQWIITIAANIPALLAAIASFIMSLKTKATANAAHSVANEAHGLSITSAEMVTRHVIVPAIRAKLAQINDDE
jgi:hypothetical protein